MIGAEAKIAEAYHALKAGELDRVMELLKDVAHPRAQALIEQARQAQQDSAEPVDCKSGG